MGKMNRALIVFTVAFAFAATTLLRKNAKEQSRFEFRKADWEAYEYQLRAAGSASHFNLELHFEAAAPPVDFRVLVNCQDPKSYYYVEFSEGEVRLGRVEQELELRIGTRKRVSIDDGEVHQAVIKRREASLVVALDGELVAEASDSTFSGGQIGLGRRGRSVDFVKVRVQPAGDVYFTDDFMRAESDESPWNATVGQWSICSLNNPSLSSNAFSYVGKGASPATSVAGEWFWDNYRAEVACRPQSTAAFGLHFCYRDQRNHFLFRWDASTAEPNAQIVRTRDGQSTVLAEAPGGFLPNQWYRLRADVTDGYATVYVDDNPTLTVSDASLCFGKIGLYTEDAQKGTEFDDVRVHGWCVFQDGFEQVCVGRWVEMGGQWQYIAGAGGQGSGDGRRLSASAEGPAKAVTGLANWQDYTFGVDIGPWGEGAAGLCFCYLDEGNHYACRWRRDGDREVRELLKVVNGVETVLAQEVAAAAGPEPMRVAVRLDRGHIRVTANRQPVFEAFDVDLPHGKVGLIVNQCPFVWFDNALVTFHTPPKPLLSVHEVFSHEKSMQIWSGAESDWERKYQDVDGWGYPVNWHRAAFHGDLDVELSAETFGPGTKAVGLVVGADEPRPDTGYRFQASKRAGPWRVVLNEGGRPVVEKELAQGHEPRRFRLRKVGRFCAAYADGRCLLWRKSEVPMAGTKVGYYARGANVEWEDVRVLTKQVHNDLFRQAPSDWRLAGGTWAVTNRWECDPRWSFFSGVSSGRRPAAIWNKRRFSGDLAVEFYAGIKMDSSRGRRYEYARNMNLTICGDGKDLSSGYSFIFGGWQNSATCITRRGAVVAKTRSFTIPYRSNIHRRWFYIRAEKTGPKLTFYVDNQRILTYTDPDPIGGGHLAIWTYDCGIMVSRVRMSFQGDAPKELPTSEAAKSTKCIYDHTRSLGW